MCALVLRGGLGREQPRGVLAAWLESLRTLAFTGPEAEEARTEKMEKEQLERRVENGSWRCPGNRGHRVSGRRE